MRLFVLILALLLVACERSGPGGTADDPGRDPDLARPASYERRFAFVAGAQAAPIVAFYDFATLYDGVRILRTARGWFREDQRWNAFLNETWASDPIRAPWRLVPHGTFRIVAGEDEDVDVLIQRGAQSETRLEAGTPLAVASPDHGVQLGLRLAELQVGAERFAGAVLDAQIARVPAPEHRLRAPDPATATAGPETVVAANGADDSTAVHEPFAELFVTDGARLYLAVSRSPVGESYLWIRDDSVEHTLEGGTVVSAGLAGRWRIVAPREDLTGELESLGPALNPADVGPFAGLAEVFLVRGSVQLATERFPVFGLLWRSRD